MSLGLQYDHKKKFQYIPKSPILSSSPAKEVEREPLNIKNYDRIQE